VVSVVVVSLSSRNTDGDGLLERLRILSMTPACRARGGSHRYRPCVPERPRSLGLNRHRRYLHCKVLSGKCAALRPGRPGRRAPACHCQWPTPANNQYMYLVPRAAKLPPPLHTIETTTPKYTPTSLLSWAPGPCTIAFHTSSHSRWLAGEADTAPIFATDLFSHPNSVMLGSQARPAPTWLPLVKVYHTPS
jgi:hypothetical protein